MTLENSLEIVNKSIEAKCTYMAMVESLTEADRLALQNAWDKGYSQRTVLRALRAEGIKSSNESIMAHKIGQCKCPKT